MCFVRAAARLLSVALSPAFSSASNDYRARLIRSEAGLDLDQEQTALMLVDAEGNVDIEHPAQKHASSTTYKTAHEESHRSHKHGKHRHLELYPAASDGTPYEADFLGTGPGSHHQSHGTVVTELDDEALAKFQAQDGVTDGWLAADDGDKRDYVDEWDVTSRDAAFPKNVSADVELAGLPAQCNDATQIPRQLQRKAKKNSNMPLHCDRDLKNIWYVYDGFRIPTKVGGRLYCGTHAPGYLSAPNPTKVGETKTIKVCYWWTASKCQWSNNIQVTNCGENYVYKLPTTRYCNLAYCFEPNPATPAPTPAPVPAGGAKAKDAASQNCVWKSWGPWAECSESCGGGEQARSRSVKQEAGANGKPCDGSSSEERECGNDPCPVNCKWAEWQHWGACSLTCGGGQRTRNRSPEQIAKHGGDHCVGDSRGVDNCNVSPCPVNCKLGEWQEWDECSKTCGGGDRKRSRDTKVEAANGGVECAGELEETGKCATDECPTTTTATTTTAAKQKSEGGDTGIVLVAVCLAGLIVAGGAVAVHNKNKRKKAGADDEEEEGEEEQVEEWEEEEGEEGTGGEGEETGGATGGETGGATEEGEEQNR